MKPLGIGLVFKAGDDVIGIAHQDDVPLGMVASPPLSPEIEDVMQVDVRQQRRGNAALRRPHLWPGHLPAFHHPSLKPFTNQADDALVADPVFQEPDQPILADTAKGSGDRLPIAEIFPIG